MQSSNRASIVKKGVEYEYPILHNPPSILIVDDTPKNLSILSQMLVMRGYHTKLTSHDKTVVQVVEKELPDLILLDIRMPGQDGYEVCRSIKQNCRLKNIPIIFLSGRTETEDKVKAFKAGGVDYITKPFHFEEVRARVETHLILRRLQLELKARNKHLETLVEERFKEICNTHLNSIFALAKLAESRDDDMGKHLERVRTFCHLLAVRLRRHPRYKKEIDDEFTENIYNASLLHDIGKVAIPDQILIKRGKLTEEEFGVMKTHADHGARTLEAVRQKYSKSALLNMGIEISRHHHEKWDGSGYPLGLEGEKIPLSARIMAVADVYDALRSARCYKPAFSHETSSKMILQESGSHFDPEVVGAFAELQDQFKESREQMAS